MSSITLPNIRVSSDLTVSLKLKDGGVAIDWSTLTNIKVSIYSDAQRALAGRCSVSIDEDDNTTLVCTYAANKPQYVGINRVVVTANYLGETKTFDKQAFNFVRWTDDQEGETITIDDPDVDVEIEVEDVSSSILQEAIDAALTAAERAEEAASLVPLQVLQDCVEATEDAEDATLAANNAAAAANAAGITSASATVDNNVGTPAVSVDLTNKHLTLGFTNLKGQTGATGATGATPNLSIGTVTTGAAGSQAAATITGTAEAPVLNLTIPQGVQGAQGNTGSSVDYAYELVNNLTTDDATKGLSAAMGVQLESEVSQLGQEIDNLGEPANITETQSVASGERFMKTINLSAYVGQPIKFKVTKNGGTSVEFIVYNADENYTLGCIFSYGLEYEYVINSAMQSLRFMGMALEESPADFEIEIEISTLYKIENAEKAKLIQKEVDYSSQLINGKYYNTNNAILPNSPVTLADCQCVTGLIREGDSLIVKGTGSSKIVSLYAFYDKDKNKLFSSANASTNSLDALEIIAPTGSYYFAFNTYNDTQTDCVRVKHIYIIEEEINKVKESNAELSSRVEELNGLLWEGKKVVCFGDSITEFADSANKRYTDYLAEITKANVVNVGIGGTRLACRTTPVANPSTPAQGYAALDCANLVDAVCTNDFSIVDAGAIYVRDNEGDDNTGIITILKAIDWSSVDIVTFFIGTNDWGGSSNMGTSGEISKRTTLGAVGFVISTLLATYPHLKIYWFTPVVRWLSPRTDENWGGNVEKAGNTLDEFVELIKTEVKKYCTPVCDMYHTLGWNKYNFSEYFYDSDGTHPTKGFPEIARKFASFITANRTF